MVSVTGCLTRKTQGNFRMFTKVESQIEVSSAGTVEKVVIFNAGSLHGLNPVPGQHVRTSVLHKDIHLI